MNTQHKDTPADAATWPPLPYAEWRDTCQTLHRMTQIVGKVRLALEPMMNHWWQVPLYVSVRGLTTSPMPTGKRLLEVEFNFIDPVLSLPPSDGQRASIPLVARPVADFYRDFMHALQLVGVDIEVWPIPVEVEGALPLAQDREHTSYDPEAVHRFWRTLVQVDRILRVFRAEFIGKSSPVHFLWGSFDMAVTRFSGRTAPPYPGSAPNLGDWVMREAYSHEVASTAFWPGNDMFPHAAFYAYA